MLLLLVHFTLFLVNEILKTRCYQVEILLRHNADTEVRGVEDGWTALIGAGYMGRTNVVRLLLKAKANVEAKVRLLEPFENFYHELLVRTGSGWDECI